jgi:Rod binding domain-containing protein
MVSLKVNSQIQPHFQSNPKATNPIKPFEEIAEGMEASFTSHMLSEMRKTIPKESPDSSAMDYYTSMLDSERSQLMAKSNTGLGVKKIILDQIVPNHMKHYLQKEHPQVRQGMTKEMTNE